MVLRNRKKILSLLFLVPVALFFMVCCCLQADAKVSEKSKCGACPKAKTQNDKTNTHDDCPHAKVKAVQDHHLLILQTAKNLLTVFYLSGFEVKVLAINDKSFIFSQIAAPPLHPSLYFQNPVLRV